MTTDIEVLSTSFQRAAHAHAVAHQAYLADRSNAELRVAADATCAAMDRALAALELARYRDAIEARVEAQAALARNPSCPTLRAAADAAFVAMELACMVLEAAHGARKAA